MGALAGAALLCASQATAAEPKSVPLAPAERVEISAVLDEFVRAGVKRKNPVAAWRLATPALRGPVSRRAWARGDLPVYPYPARGERFHHWTLAFSYRNWVGVDLLLQPVSRLRRKLGPIMFAVDLRRQRGHWRVDSFNPTATYPPEGQPPRMFAVADLLPSPRAERSAKPRLGGEWWVALLGLLVLLPVGTLAAWLCVVLKHRRAAGVPWRRRALPPALPASARARLRGDASTGGLHSPP